jgi:hypothetical protein
VEPWVPGGRPARVAAFGAGLFALAGGATVSVFDAVTFVIAAVMLSRIRLREARPAPQPRSWRAGLLAGLGHIRRTPELRGLLAAASVVMSFSAVLVAAQYSLVQAAGEPPAFLGVLSAGLGAGSIAASMVSGRLLRSAGERWLAVLGMAISAWNCCCSYGTPEGSGAMWKCRCALPCRLPRLSRYIRSAGAVAAIALASRNTTNLQPPELRLAHVVHPALDVPLGSDQAVTQQCGIAGQERDRVFVLIDVVVRVVRMPVQQRADETRSLPRTASIGCDVEGRPGWRLIWHPADYPRRTTLADVPSLGTRRCTTSGRRVRAVACVTHD